MSKKEEYGILPENWEVIDNLDMTKEYTDKEIESIYNQIFHMDDEKQRKAMHEYETIYNPFGSRFVKKVKTENREEAMATVYYNSFFGMNFDNDYFQKQVSYLMGEATKEELNKQRFISSFKASLEK